jgi:hypothetical protein
MKAEVFTYITTPFAFGSKGFYAKATIEAEALVDLGKGFEGYVFKTPDGVYRVAEAKSGAFVGKGSTFLKAISQVKDDISFCKDINLMEKQIGDAMSLSKRQIPTEEFLSYFK